MKYVFFLILLFCYHINIAQLQLLNDEFNNSATLSANWLNLNTQEAWGVEHLEAHDINTSSAGQLYMMPYNYRVKALLPLWVYRRHSLPSQRRR